MNVNHYPFVLLIAHCIVFFGICLKYCINVFLNSRQVAKVNHKCCKIVYVLTFLEGQTKRTLIEVECITNLASVSLVMMSHELTNIQSFCKKIALNNSMNTTVPSLNKYYGKLVKYMLDIFLL